MNVFFIMSDTIIAIFSLCIRPARSPGVWFSIQSSSDLQFRLLTMPPSSQKNIEVYQLPAINRCKFHHWFQASYLLKHLHSTYGTSLLSFLPPQKRNIVLTLTLMTRPFWSKTQYWSILVLFIISTQMLHIRKL